MKVEIVHDTLAKTVYEKVSMEDRMRLHVINLIKTKYILFQEKHTYLSADDLKVIAPYEDRLTVTKEERSFINESQRETKKQERWITIIVVTVILTIIIGLFLWGKWYKAKNIEIKHTNELLLLKQDSLNQANIAIKDQYDILRYQDSIRLELSNKLDNRDNIISMTNKELQAALNALRVANQQLAAKQAELEAERNKLRDDKKNLKEQLKDHDAIKRKLSVAEKSQELSQKANQILQASSKPTEGDYKEAFLLARAAWEMSKNNSQAMDVLNDLYNKRIQRSDGGGFLSDTTPKYTYTHRKIEAYIRKIDQKYRYGKLSEGAIIERLR